MHSTLKRSKRRNYWTSTLRARLSDLASVLHACEHAWSTLKRAASAQHFYKFSCGPEVPFEARFLQTFIEL
jgi:hypothetical protein